MGSTESTNTVVRPSPEGSSGVPNEVLLGRYRVLARRGTGGFGAVCTCWDTRLQRRVAIKRIPVLSGAELRGMSTSTVEEALAEARTACLLAHPNIVTVYDFETDGSYAYIVMEYVDGLNLSELLARVEGGVLTHDECAHLVKSVSEALSYAHENGVLHLDIKPTNIMIDRQGTVKLTDFGMATLASAAGYGGARGGTVGYMPPEQIQGLMVDERADVFSLAVVTWQALTGKDPFAAGSAKDSLDVIARGPKPPLAKLDPSLGPTAIAAIDQAILPDATMREPSIDDFSSRVLADLGDSTVGATSLRNLIDQSEQDDPEEPWDVRHLPAYVRFPWLSSVIERAISAIFTFLFINQTLSSSALNQDTFSLAAALISAGVCAFWPPSGSVFAIIALVASVATTTITNASFPLALVLGVGLFAWWLNVGRQDFVASGALLAPSVTLCPAAGVALAGYGMDPLPAAITGGVGALFSLVYDVSIESAMSAQAIAYNLAPLLASASTWVVIGFCALGAGVASSIAMRGSVASGLVGQGVGFTLAILGLVWSSQMENGWVWTSTLSGSCAIAVLLSVTLCIETVLRGPLDGDQESEDSYELS